MTANGVSVGATVQALQRAYGDRLELFDEPPDGPQFGVQTPEGGLYGSLTSLEAVRHRPLDRERRRRLRTIARGRQGQAEIPGGIGGIGSAGSRIYARGRGQRSLVTKRRYTPCRAHRTAAGGQRSVPLPDGSARHREQDHPDSNQRSKEGGPKDPTSSGQRSIGSTLESPLRNVRPCRRPLELRHTRSGAATRAACPQPSASMISGWSSGREVQIWCVPGQFFDEGDTAGAEEPRRHVSPSESGRAEPEQAAD